MALELSKTLPALLQATFPEQQMEQGREPHILVTFHSPHPKVGSVSITDEGDELTVFLTDRTRFHIACDAEGLTDAQRASNIASQLIDFLRALFSDEIEFYGYGSGGGCRKRSTAPRSLFSRLFLGWESYVWSGPLKERRSDDR
jgi:hypothetical protein